MRLHSVLRYVYSDVTKVSASLRSIPFPGYHLIKMMNNKYMTRI